VETAKKGDTVWVNEGTIYLFNAGSIVIETPGILLKSTHMAAKTVLDGGGANRSVIQIPWDTFNSMISTVIDGFTITGSGVLNSSNTPLGGGIRAQNANLKIRNCVITGNSALGGAGVYLDEGLLNMEDSRVEVNSGGISDGGKGGGIFLDGSDAQFSHTVIYGNTAKFGAGIYGLSSKSIMLSYSIVDKNLTTSSTGTGAAIYLADAIANLNHSTIAYNVDDSISSGTTLGIVLSGASLLQSYNSIVAFNGQSSGDNIGVYGGSATFVWDYSDVYPFDSLSESAYSYEPYFVDLGARNYHLTVDDALYDLGDPDEFDLDGTRAGLGMFGGAGGGAWDKDGDLLPDYFWPGGVCDAPDGFDAFEYDSDDWDAAVGVMSSCL